MEQDHFSVEAIQRMIGRKKEPLVSIFLPEHADQAWRNYVFRAMMYFSVCENSTPANLAGPEILDVTMVFFQNRTAEAPFRLRFASAKTIRRFLNYIHANWNDQFPGDVVPVRMYVDVEGSGFGEF